LRPEDNVAAATVEIVEAALASSQPEAGLLHRCRIPSIVSDVRLERAATAETLEHELLGDLLEAQAAKSVAGAAEATESGAASNSNTPVPLQARSPKARSAWMPPVSMRS